MSSGSAPRPAVFLDRDGVLNEDSGYVHRVETFTWIEGAREAVRRLRELGYLTVLVTNQSGIARGLYGLAQFEALQRHIARQLSDAGGALDAVYYCPHLPGGVVAPYGVECDCRKPRPGMLLRAAQELRLDLSRSLMIGDKQSDMDAARAAGVRGILFAGGSLLRFVDEHVPAAGLDSLNREG